MKAWREAREESLRVHGEVRAVEFSPPRGSPEIGPVSKM
jgi:hypothetical protein